jgi:hypothetical protein
MSDSPWILLSEAHALASSPPWESVKIGQPHSSRNAAMGCSFAARCAGKKLAARPTATIPATAAVNVSGCAGRPTVHLRRKRVHRCARRCGISEVAPGNRRRARRKYQEEIQVSIWRFQQSPSLRSSLRRESCSTTPSSSSGFLWLKSAP